MKSIIYDLTLAVWLINKLNLKIPLLLLIKEFSRTVEQFSISQHKWVYYYVKEKSAFHMVMIIQILFLRKIRKRGLNGCRAACLFIRL